MRKSIEFFTAVIRFPRIIDWNTVFYSGISLIKFLNSTSACRKGIAFCMWQIGGTDDFTDLLEKCKCKHITRRVTSAAARMTLLTLPVVNSV